MTINSYFNTITYTETQDLIDSLKQETIQIFGQNMFFIPRNENIIDTLYGEDILNNFSTKYEIEMYVETVEEFGGDKQIFSKFGFEVADKTEMSVNATRFKEVTTLDKPNEGDLVYWSLPNKLFVITFVDLDSDFYELGKNYNYKISMDLFSYNQETLTTGISKIDELNNIDITDDIFDDNIDKFDDTIDFNLNELGE